MSNRILLAFVLSFLAGPALAGEDLPVSAVTETVGYASAAEAAVAALRVAMPRSGDFEHGGVVVELEGAFYYSEPVTNGDTGRIRFQASFRRGARLAAIYHTHPTREPDARMFSWNDVAEARKLGVESFIGVLGDGTIRSFDPARTPTRAYERAGSMISPGRVSDGVIVATLDGRASGGAL